MSITKRRQHRFVAVCLFELTIDLTMEFIPIYFHHPLQRVQWKKHELYRLEPTQYSFHHPMRNSQFGKIFPMITLSIKRGSGAVSKQAAIPCLQVLDSGRRTDRGRLQVPANPSDDPPDSRPLHQRKNERGRLKLCLPPLTQNDRVRPDRRSRKDEGMH
jgi:hypothetical protein